MIQMKNEDLIQMQREHLVKKDAMIKRLKWSNKLLWWSVVILSVALIKVTVF